MRCTASELFAIVWTALVDVIGPTATAALLQRSVARAGRQGAGLADLTITRDQFAYAYAVPPSWTSEHPESIAALRHVLAELWPLLLDLTGDVVVRRLTAIPTLTHCGVIPKDAEL